MAAGLRQDRIFLGLTRPQMIGGVTYTFFVINMIIAAELFLIFKSFWIIPVALVLHLAGMLVCLREPRFFDLWITRVSRCPRTRNYAVWGCNSYQP
jgi:type IV secretion system protein VirB3